MRVSCNKSRVELEPPGQGKTADENESRRSEATNVGFGTFDPSNDSESPLGMQGLFCEWFF